MDQPSCREAIDAKSRNLNRRNLCRAAVKKVSSNCREDISKVFQGKKSKCLISNQMPKYLSKLMENIFQVLSFKFEIQNKLANAN